MKPLNHATPDYSVRISPTARALYASEHAIKEGDVAKANRILFMPAAGCVAIALVVLIFGR
jgi:hypothetical protein